MKIAVTGASGHVGNYLCKKLVEQGVRVKALLHHHPDELEQIGVELVKGDICDPKALDQLLEGADVVYHLAARISINNKNREEIYRINLEGTRSVVKACLKHDVGRLIHFSTIHTLQMEDVNERIDETKPLVTAHRIWYEHSKAEAERVVLKAVSEGMDAVIITPTAIIGPYDHAPSLLGQALIRIYKNQLPMLITGGYDVVDVRDVVEGAISAAEKGRRGERYLLSGKWYSLGELSRVISRISGSKTPTWVAPPVVARIGLPFIQLYAKITGQEPLYTRQSLYILKHSGRNISSEKATQELGYQSRPLVKTLEDTFTWYQQNGML